MRSAQQVAMYVIEKCCIDGCAVSNLQLQKILYYLQVAFLRNFGYTCFDDDIEAWKFGPVVRSVYNKYCGYGSLKICEVYSDDNIFDREEENCVNSIIEDKRIAKPWNLVRDTHAKGKAWDLVYDNGLGNKTIIPKGMLIENG